MNYSQEFEALTKAYELSGGDRNLLQSNKVASLLVSGNQVLGANEIPGVHMRSEQTERGVRVWLRVEPNTVPDLPIHLCFGVIPEQGVQEIVSEYDIGAGASVEFLAHCSFPNAVEVTHLMNAVVRVGAGASMIYNEVHYHGPQGGVMTYPKTRATVGPKGRYVSNFKMIEGKVGTLEIDYEAELADEAIGEFTTKAYGKGEDSVVVREVLYLRGAGARGLTKTNVVAVGHSSSDVFTEMHGLAPGARGHMDCTEVIGEKATAKNVPVVVVTEATAKVTHEAAIGRLDQKPIETLMARGLSEDEATEVVVEGLLR